MEFLLLILVIPFAILTIVIAYYLSNILLQFQELNKKLDTLAMILKVLSKKRMPNGERRPALIGRQAIPPPRLFGETRS